MIRCKEMGHSEYTNYIFIYKYKCLYTNLLYSGLFAIVFWPYFPSGRSMKTSMSWRSYYTKRKLLCTHEKTRLSTGSCFRRRLFVLSTTQNSDGLEPLSLRRDVGTYVNDPFYILNTYVDFLNYSQFMSSILFYLPQG